MSELGVGGGVWRKVENRLRLGCIPRFSLSTCPTSLQNYWPGIRTGSRVGVPRAGERGEAGEVVVLLMTGRGMQGMCKGVPQGYSLHKLGKQPNFHTNRQSLYLLKR